MRATWPMAVGAALTIVATPPLPARATSGATSQTAVVQRYLGALQAARYDEAYTLLNAAERAYYRDAKNFRSVYVADAYRVTAFALVGSRSDDRVGRLFYARETARYRDHAHDVDLTVTATVPVGVVAEAGGWRIKDPGHPWRAFASRADARANGLRVAVKKMSFFARRIETVVSFVNAGPSFVTILPYGKSIVHDSAGRPCRIIETTNWSLTDKTLFEGLHLAPNAQYTGVLAFECAPHMDATKAFSLTIAPLLYDGADEPFSVNIDNIVDATTAAK